MSDSGPTNSAIPEPSPAVKATLRDKDELDAEFSYYWWASDDARNDFQSSIYQLLRENCDIKNFHLVSSYVNWDRSCQMSHRLTGKSSNDGFIFL